MATTTNYGWTTPDDTALVKDGAAAIRSLGTAIDTSMNTALGTKKAGMVLLNTTSFSAVATQSINSVFNSTYENYLVVICFTSTVGGGKSIKLRASGTDASTNYHQEQIVANGTTNAAARYSSQTEFFAGSSGSNLSTINCYIYSPFASTVTAFDATNGANLTSTTNFMVKTTGYHSTASSYDGFTIIDTGSMTGTVYTYGLAK